MDSTTKTKEQPNVFTSVASYYNPATKKWEMGAFTLTKNHIQFIADSNNDQFHLCLPLSTITGIEKRLSSLIYPSLVISVGSEKHWLCSFSNRDAVYNLLELFWREALLSKPYKTASVPKTIISNSMLGRDLLNLLHESETTLVETANTLSDQGRQLHDSEDAIQDINNDLDVAEKVLKVMPFPQTLPGINASFRERNGNVQQLELKVKRYKVTFSFTKTSNDDGNWEKGTLIIADSVTVQDEQGNNKIHVTGNELESLQVISPWELCITQSAAATPKSCYVICPQLSRLLKFVSSVPELKEKVIYADDDSSFYETASCSSSSSGSALSSPSCRLANVSPSQSENNTTEHIQDSCNILSEDDMLQLSNYLNKLQTLAAEVGREQQNQNEQLNNLKSDIDKTELRIKANNKKMRKHT